MLNAYMTTKTFGRMLTHYFLKKGCINNRITLVEDNEIISDFSKCTEIMNNFFTDPVLNLEINRVLHTDVFNSADPITSAIQKYKNHPSILKLDEIQFQTYFRGRYDKPISEEDMTNMIQSIDTSEAFQKDDIPPKSLKANVDICSIVLTSDVNRWYIS